MKKIFSKHIIEIRYKPNSRFLDKRGEIAESLTGSFLTNGIYQITGLIFLVRQMKTSRLLLVLEILGFLLTFRIQQIFLKKKQKNL